MMSTTHSGSCLCGQVRFEVAGDFEQFFLCHCEYCRKDSGSAHAANLFSSTASLKWLNGLEKVRSFNLPSTRHTRSFCSICGSALPYADAAAAFLVVPAGSLDSELRLRPNAHLFAASRAAWDQGLESIPSFPGFPS
jgi:hypothetical protein